MCFTNFLREKKERSDTSPHETHSLTSFLCGPKDNKYTTAQRALYTRSRSRYSHTGVSDSSIFLEYV